MCFTCFLAYLRAQRLKCAELELLDSAFGLSQRNCNFANALFFGETHLNNAALFRGQLINQAKKAGAFFDFFDADVRVRRFIGRPFSLLPGRAVPTVRNRVGRDAKKPGCERNAAPLVAAKVRERRMEHFGGYVLRRIAASHAARDIGIDALEIAFVKLGEKAGIPLRSLDELSLARFPLHSLQRRLRIICS